MEMEIDEDYNSNAVHYYSIRVKTYEPLRIALSHYNGRSNVVLWNMFHIFIYDSDDFSSPQIHYNAKDLIRNVYSISNSNILLVQDLNHNLYFTIIRNGNSKKLQDKFQLKKFQEKILFVIDNGREFGTVQRIKERYEFKIFDIINSEFQHKETFLLPCVDSLLNCGSIFYMKKMYYFETDYLENVLSLDAKKINLNRNILFIVNNDTVFITVLQDETKEFTKLHTCPVPIKSIEFDEKICSKIYLCLITGSVIILSSDKFNQKVDLDIVHLNCAIERIFFKKLFIYTDCQKLWKSMIKSSNGKVFHKNIKLQNIFDISYDDVNNFMYCISLNNLLYVFNNEEFSDDVKKKDFIPIPKCMKEVQHIFQNMLIEFEKNDDILRDIKYEDNLIKILALKQKANIVKKHLQTKIIFYDDMVKMTNEGNILLVNDLKDYCDNKLIYVINFNMSDSFETNFKEVFELTQNMWIAIIKLQYSEHNQTIVVNVCNNVPFNIAIPVEEQIHTVPFIFNIKLIALIPGVNNNNVFTWCIFPSNITEVDSKYHLRIHSDFIKKTVFNLKDKIFKLAEKYAGHIYKIPKELLNLERTPVSFYLRLPKNFGDVMNKFVERFTSMLNSYSAKNISQKMCEIFLNSNEDLKLVSLTDDIFIKIIQDSTMQKIKIVGSNIQVCWELYSFVCYDIISEYCTLKTLPHFDYTKLKKIKEAVSDILHTSHSFNKETLVNLLEEFSCDVLGELTF